MNIVIFESVLVIEIKYIYIYIFLTEYMYRQYSVFTVSKSELGVRNSPKLNSMA
jgi:hypothetical protein